MSCPSSRRSGASAAALLLLLGVPAAGQAQDVEVVSRFVVTQGWESNVLGRSEGGNEDDIIDDFVTRVSPTLSLQGRSETGSAALMVGSRARLYQELTELDSLDPMARFDLDQALSSRLSVFTEASWSQSKSTDPIDLDSFQIYNGRPDIERSSAEGGFAYQLSSLSSLRLSYRTIASEFDATEDSGAQRDRRTDSWTAQYTYALSPLSQIQGAIAYQSSNYDPIAPVVGIAGRDSQDDSQIAVTFGYSRSLSPRTTLTLTGGMRSLHSEGNGFSNAILCGPTVFGCPAGQGPTNLPLDERNTAFTGGLALTRTAKRGSLTLAFNQQTRPSSGRSASVDVQTYSASFTHRLTERLRLRLGLSLSDQTSASDNFVLTDAFTIGGLEVCPGGSLPGRRFDPDLSVASVCAVPVESAIDDRLWYVNANVDWRVSKRFTTFLSYDYIKQDSLGVVGQTYDNHRVQIGLRYFHDVDVP